MAQNGEECSWITFQEEIIQSMSLLSYIQEPQDPRVHFRHPNYTERILIDIVTTVK
jgi:hypothetical protein